VAHFLYELPLSRNATNFDRLQGSDAARRHLLDFSLLVSHQPRGSGRKNPNQWPQCRRGDAIEPWGIGHCELAPKMQTGSLKWPAAAEMPPCCFQLRVLATNKKFKQSQQIYGPNRNRIRTRSAFKNTKSADACQRLSTANQNQKPGKSAKGNHEENPRDPGVQWKTNANPQMTNVCTERFA